MRIFRYFILVTSAFVLWLPLSLGVLGVKTNNLIPGDAEVKFPDFPDKISQVDDYTDSVFKFLEKQFPMRELLIRTGASIRFALHSIADKGAIQGEDKNWLFYTGEGVFQQTTGQRLNIEAVERVVNTVDWLYQDALENGRRLVVINPPNKESIYRENLPEWAKSPIKFNELDFLIYRLTEKGLPVIDLRPLLLAAKQYGPVYWRCDTHWNSFGALVAFNAVSKQFGLKANLSKVNSILLGYQQIDFDGDLARMSGIKSCMEQTPLLAIGSNFDLQIQPIAIKGDFFAQPAFKLIGKNPGPRLLIIGDSFTRESIKFLRVDQFFSEIIWIHHQSGLFNREVLKIFNPQLVLFAPVERAIGSWAFEPI